LLGGFTNIDCVPSTKRPPNPLVEIFPLCAGSGVGFAKEVCVGDGVEGPATGDDDGNESLGDDGPAEDMEAKEVDADMAAVI